MGQSPGGGGVAKDKTSQEEKWRRRSMQANRQLFLKDTRKSKSEPGKGALPALMAFDEDGLEEEEEEEEEEEVSLDRRQTSAGGWVVS